ncbi:MAG TPA: hypothetical protein VGD91_13775 [Trebonia sp.]
MGAALLHRRREGVQLTPAGSVLLLGQGDRMLRADRRLAVQEALGLRTSTLVPGRHFTPEDQAPALAAVVAQLTPVTGA